MLPGIAAIGGFVAEYASGGGSFWIEVSDDSVFKTSGTSGGTRTLTTAPVTVTAHGGSGSPTYAWVRTAGDAAIAAGSPTAASTSFSATVSPGDEVDATFVCTVTDGSGARQMVTVTVTITLLGYGSL